MYLLGRCCLLSSTETLFQYFAEIRNRFYFFPMKSTESPDGCHIQVMVQVGLSGCYDTFQRSLLHRSTARKRLRNCTLPNLSHWQTCCLFLPPFFLLNANQSKLRTLPGPVEYLRRERGTVCLCVFHIFYKPFTQTLVQCFKHGR